MSLLLDELTHQVKDAEVSIIFTSEEQVPKIKKLATEVKQVKVNCSDAIEYSIIQL